MFSEDTKNILIVDHPKSFSLNINNILLSAGHHTRIVDSKEEIISALKKDPLNIDLMIINLNMPHIDAFDILEWLRNSGRTGKPPVIAVIESTEAKKIHRVLRGLRVFDCIIKGTSPEMCIFKINKILYPKNQQRKNLRINTELPVFLSSKDINDTGYILNISETGAYVSTNTPIKIGDTTKVRFMLKEEDRYIETTGKVVWTANYKGVKKPVTGMGIQFSGITSKDSRLISSFIKHYISRVY